MGKNKNLHKSTVKKKFRALMVGWKNNSGKMLSWLIPCTLQIHVPIAIVFAPTRLGLFRQAFS